LRIEEDHQYIELVSAGNIVVSKFLKINVDTLSNGTALFEFSSFCILKTAEACLCVWADHRLVQRLRGQERTPALLDFQQRIRKETTQCAHDGFVVLRQATEIHQSET
jgi:hypothetical protein